MANDNENKDSIEDIEFHGLGIDISLDAEGRRNAPDCEDLPVIATRNLVLFPGVTIPISLGRPNSLLTAKRAHEAAMPVGIVCQIDADEDTPAVTTGLYKYGVFADILKLIKLPDGNYTAVVQARGKFRIMGRGRGTSMPEAQLTARVKTIPDVKADNEYEYGLLVEQVRKLSHEILEQSSDATVIVENLKNITDNDEFVNFAATNLPFDPNSKSQLADRAYGLLTELTGLEQKLDITRNIMSRARRNMEENQRSAFLQQQMDTIREELYGDSADEIDELVKKARALDMPKAVMDTFIRESDKLRRYNPQSPDYSVQFSYLETLLALPWNVLTSTNNNLNSARDILESDHYGLEKVKERILEQLAVLMHNPRGKAPIICLVGAPGVGKTSIGRSLARALGRKYERVSLGGLHDEAEIRGHRRTYVGAMPGRIIEAMKRVGVSNPILLLDEIDKIGADFKGDPAAALLEVLDPEQNCRFHDNYIDVDYDLSRVLFIATANTLSTLARPLLDRMEIIDISGYVLEEKMEIARRHLLPRILGEHKLTEADLSITDDGLSAIIARYTSESGVRQLEKKLSALARKAVMFKMEKRDFHSPVTSEDLYDLLGLAPRESDSYEGNEFAGVVTGLAWTEVGGEILMAESSLSPGNGERLTITGNLGNVMKESATIALEWVKAHAKVLGIDPALFGKYNLHIHFPEGAIPKDGPSAGITIATSIVSTFLQRRVAERIAMTGEITLRGKVLPVGGIREKILAAKRAGIETIVLSKRNKRDIEDIPARYLDGMNFHYVDTVSDVIDYAITDTPAVGALEL